MNPKYSLYVHLLAQILAQSAIVALVPNGKPHDIFAAVVAIVGVVVAYYDTSHAQNVVAAGGTLPVTPVK